MRSRLSLSARCTRSGIETAAEVIVPFVRDPEKTVHDEAILTVGRLRITKAVADLKELYESGIEENRKILGSFPSPERMIWLKKLYQALSHIGDPSCKELFRRDSKMSGCSTGVWERKGWAKRRQRQHLVGCHSVPARKRPGSEARDELRALRLGREEHLLELAQAGDQGLEYLLELEASEMPKLYPYLDSEKNGVKVRILTAIGQRGDRSAVPVVERFMKSENGDVASAANLALRRLRGRFPS